MPDEHVKISIEEMDKLGTKLEGLDALDDADRKLLLATFALAGQAASQQAEGEVEGFSFSTAPPEHGGWNLTGTGPLTSTLSKGFANSFVRGGGHAGNHLDAHVHI